MASSHSSSTTRPTTRSSARIWPRPGPRRSTRRRASTRSTGCRPRPGTTGARCGWRAAVITIFGTAPLDARHFVVLPLLLLAAAALTGTVVRRMTGSTSRGPSCSGSWPACSWRRCHSSRARTSARGPSADLRDHAYGLAAVAVLLAMYSLAVLGRRPATWALAVFVGSAAASIVPGPHRDRRCWRWSGSGASGRSGSASRSSRRDGCRSSRPVWRRTFVGDRHRGRRRRSVWGLLTGHGIGEQRLVAERVPPFNASWRDSVAIIAPGLRSVPRDRGRLVHGPRGGVDRGGPVPRHGRALVDRRARLGRAARRLQHVPPVLRRASPCSRRRPPPSPSGRSGCACARPDTRAWRSPCSCSASCSSRSVSGWASSGLQLRPGNYAPVPVEILDAIRSLPPDAKLAYACRPSEEVCLLGRRSSSASTPTPDGASCRCASRRRRSAR